MGAWHYFCHFMAVYSTCNYNNSQEGQLLGECARVTTSFSRESYTSQLCNYVGRVVWQVLFQQSKQEKGNFLFLHRATTNLNHFWLNDLNNLLIYINKNLSPVQGTTKTEAAISNLELRYNAIRRRVQIVNLETWCKHRKCSSLIWHRWKNKNCNRCVLVKVERLLLHHMSFYTQWKKFQHLLHMTFATSNHVIEYTVGTKVGRDSKLLFTETLLQMQLYMEKKIDKNQKLLSINIVENSPTCHQQTSRIPDYHP